LITAEVAVLMVLRVGHSHHQHRDTEMAVMDREELLLVAQLEHKVL
jgi:hypothetical protein